MSWRDQIIGFIQENAKPVDKYDHQPRLYALTRQIGGGISYDDDVVFAAAWLHDLGVFVGHRPEDPVELAHWNNVVYACGQAPGILRRTDFPVAKTAAVVEAIRTHQPSAAPTTIEGTILRDADILEQLGATAVIRALVKVGRDTRFPTHHEVVPVLQSALRDLPAQVRLASAQALAVPRATALKEFLQALQAETALPA